MLFDFFGISALCFKEEEEIAEKPGRGIFLTTFLMIFMAKFGDKTQIAVAGMSSTADTKPPGSSPAGAG